MQLERMSQNSTYAYKYIYTYPHINTYIYICICIYKIYIMLFYIIYYYIFYICTVLHICVCIYTHINDIYNEVHDVEIWNGNISRKTGKDLFKKLVRSDISNILIPQSLMVWISESDITSACLLQLFPGNSAFFLEGMFWICVCSLLLDIFCIFVEEFSVALVGGSNMLCINVSCGNSRFKEKNRDKSIIIIAIIIYLSSSSSSSSSISIPLPLCPPIKFVNEGVESESLLLTELS